MAFNIARIRKLTDSLADVDVAMGGVHQGDYYGPWGPAKPDGSPTYEPQLSFEMFNRGRVEAPAQRYLDRALLESIREIVSRARELAREDQFKLQEELALETRMSYNPPGVGPAYTQMEMSPSGDD